MIYNYHSPQCEVLLVKAENGFAQSGPFMEPGSPGGDFSFDDYIPGL